MPELKPKHGPIAKAVQFIKQIADLLIQRELVARRRLPPAAFATKSRNPHHLRITVHDWLTGTDCDILNSAELVLPH
jgi:hypothetical protein